MKTFSSEGTKVKINNNDTQDELSFIKYILDELLNFSKIEGINLEQYDNMDVIIISDNDDKEDTLKVIEKSTKPYIPLREKNFKNILSRLKKKR